MCDGGSAESGIINSTVSILVLVDAALRRIRERGSAYNFLVSILVLVDAALRRFLLAMLSVPQHVSILVLVDAALRPKPERARSGDLVFQSLF